MGDQQQCALVRLERLLQLLDGDEVEVVGRLVEHQEVRAAGLEERQSGPRPLARRELADAAAVLAERLGEGGTLPADLLADLGRLSSLVEDLLLLARSDADVRAPVLVEELDAHALITELATAYAGQRVPVTVRPGQPVLIMADAGELRRALGNLVTNAVRHARSAVELAATVEHDEAVLSVSDDGPGIAAPDRERVFERFTRLDDARDRDAGGSGLGLSIVRAAVERDGGAVRAEDPLSGVGALLRVRLPLAGPAHDGP